MTLEELQAKAEALESEKESVVNKNKELLSELKTARTKNKDVDIDAHYKLADELEAVKAENNKLNATLKMKDKDLEKLTSLHQEASGKLTQLSYDDAINKTLDGLELAPNMRTRAMKLLKADATFKDGALSFGDKSPEDFLKEWTSPTGDGYIFLSGKEHSGGGASGGGNPAPSDKPTTRAEEYSKLFNS